ncbi:MAG: DUF839 domain-containing protein [Planctomycetaceae bacterium]
MSHEGLKFDNDGNLYFVDENSSGSIYKFVPTTIGDLSSGQTFVLKADAAGDAAVGHATWVPITNADGTAAAAGMTSDPFDFTSRGGRAAADEVGGTGFNRPEDLEFGFLSNGNPVIYFTVTGTHSVYSLELTDADNAEIRLMASNATPFNAGYAGTTATLASPDNLAIDAQGNVYVIEDQANTTTNGVPGGDVFLLRDTDGDGVAESLDHVLSHSVPGAEITGMIFSPVNPNQFIISIQHPASTGVAGGTGDALWLITMPGPATSTPLADSGATVDWAVSSTQADGTDFDGGSLPAGTLNFAPGEFSKTISVMVQGDMAFEPDEDFTVTLSNPSAGATIATAAATSTILNDDFSDSAAPRSQVRRSGSIFVTTKDLPIEVTGRDFGTVPSGIAQFEIYVRTNLTGGYSLFTTIDAVPGSVAGTFEASTTFSGDSNTTYQFYSVAVDFAGNREDSIEGPHADVLYRFRDVDAPQSQVDGVTFDNASGTFAVDYSGTDIGGSIREFSVWMQVDSDMPVVVATVGGNSPGTVQAAAVPGTHDYRFFTVATDNSGNVEAAPDAPLDITLTGVDYSITPPPVPEIVDFDVQNGAAQRSFVNTLTVTFSDSSDLQELIDSVATGSSRVRLVNTGLDGTGTTVIDLSTATISLVGRTVTIGLGTAGLTADGIYELQFDLDNNASFESTRTFHRIQGDADGDGDADIDDLMKIRRALIYRNDPEADVNGDGVVNVLDYVYAARNFGALLDADAGLSSLEERLLLDD